MSHEPDGATAIVERSSRIVWPDHDDEQREVA